MMKKFIFYLVLISIIVLSKGNGSHKLKKLFEWCPGKIKFDFEQKELVLPHLLKTGKFIPKNNVPLGVALHPHKKIMFVTVPRWKRGVISTLNWVPIGAGDLNEPLRPYPCWEANDIHGGSIYPFKIISAIRVFVDSCDRMWVADSGYEDTMGNRTQIEPPKLLIFDINKNVLIHKYVFDSSVTEAAKSSLGKIVVDCTPETCHNAFAYITDVINPGLIVYSFAKNKAYRIENNYLRLEPLKSSIIIEGKKIFLGTNIDGICLSRMYKDGYRNLYLNAQATNKQFITTTKYLQNESYYRSGADIIYYLGERCSHCMAGGGQVVDEKTGVLFYSELNSNAIACWNGDHENYGPETHDRVAVSRELNYVSEMTITSHRELVAVSCQLNYYFYTDKDVTVRVFAGKVDSLIEGTICQKNVLEPANCY